MLLRVPAEVRERLLVRIEQLAERLAQTGHVDAPAREAERQHEDVSHLPLRVEPNQIPAWPQRLCCSDLTGNSTDADDVVCYGDTRLEAAHCASYGLHVSSV